MRLVDKTGRVHIDRTEPDGGDGRPEIDRKDLRRLLVDSLRPGTIAWGRKVVAARPGTSGHVLEFADGSADHADLVVGADGVWSRIRPLLTPVEPGYTGITLVEIRPTRRPGTRKRSHASSGGASSRCRTTCSSAGMAGTPSRSACGLRVPENWVAGGGIDWDDLASVRTGLLREYADWAPALTSLIRDCDDDAVWPRPIYALPIGLT